ncbi:MAG: Kae1-associated serine/threonine protein kinase [Candidatus Thorarchaeota archaeon]|nr:Kae1-associated serine/threonine protein kinase [Candidatus Thorarchaeota archaeon]
MEARVMKEHWALGAESVIYRIERWGETLLLKQRPKKPYLLEAIDTQLRQSRTSRECKMLNVARSLGVPTPAVHWVDKSEYAIAMDYIAGTRLRELVQEVSPKNLENLCSEFGRLIALLHAGDVVHGDPTTSNVLIDELGKMWLIDFGLGEMNATTEMKGVDLHLMKRAFETTHWDIQDKMLDATLGGYKEALGDSADPIMVRMEEIRERGRYH